jgi:hypothetical protein
MMARSNMPMRLARMTMTIQVPIQVLAAQNKRLLTLRSGAKQLIGCPSA